MPLGYKDVAQIPFIHLSYRSGGVYECVKNETWPPLHAHGASTNVFLGCKILVPRTLSSCKRACTSKYGNSRNGSIFVQTSCTLCIILAPVSDTCFPSPAAPPATWSTSLRTPKTDLQLLITPVPLRTSPPPLPKNNQTSERRVNSTIVPEAERTSKWGCGSRETIRSHLPDHQEHIRGTLLQ